MSETSGEASMLKVGSKNLVLLAAQAVLLVNSHANSQEPTSYYVSCYENAHQPTNILVAKVNLDDKTIEYSVSLPFAGALLLSKPLVFQRGERVLLVVSTVNDLPAKNSVFLDTVISNYAVIDQAGNILVSSHMPQIEIHEVEGSAGADYTIRYSYRGNAMTGNLRLGRGNMLSVVPDRDYVYIDSDYPYIGGFRFFHRITPSNEGLYWVTTARGWYLLRLDVERRELLDSLKVGDDSSRFYLFGLSEDTSNVYCFTMNSNIVGGPEDLRKLTIDPSYLKIYRRTDFALNDSIPIPYPPLDSGYVCGGTGLIDRVGPYFCYFDLNGEDYRYFSPAMLFIFDTRTNEATWLRVGWK